jgi:hypothetical protein
MSRDCTSATYCRLQMRAPQIIRRSQNKHRHLVQEQFCEPHRVREARTALLPQATIERMPTESTKASTYSRLTSTAKELFRVLPSHLHFSIPKSHRASIAITNARPRPRGSGRKLESTVLSRTMQTTRPANTLALGSETAI